MSEIKERFLTRREVAKLLGVSVNMLGDLGRRGEGPRFIHVGSRIRYPESDLRSWLANQGDKPKK